HQQRKPGMPLELDEEALHAHAHPLLASWGRQGRDYIALLEELEEETAAQQSSAAGQAGNAPVVLRPAPAFVEVESESILGRLQDDIRGLHSLADVRQEGRVAAATDDSIHFHVAHS